VNAHYPEQAYILQGDSWNDDAIHGEWDKQATVAIFYPLVTPDSYEADTIRIPSPQQHRAKNNCWSFAAMNCAYLTKKIAEYYDDNPQATFVPKSFWQGFRIEYDGEAIDNDGRTLLAEIIRGTVLPQNLAEAKQAEGEAELKLDSKSLNSYAAAAAMPPAPGVQGHPLRINNVDDDIKADTRHNSQPFVVLIDIGSFSFNHRSGANKLTEQFLQMMTPRLEWKGAELTRDSVRDAQVLRRGGLCVKLNSKRALQAVLDLNGYTIRMGGSDYTFKARIPRAHKSQSKRVIDSRRIKLDMVRVRTNKQTLTCEQLQELLANVADDDPEEWVVEWKSNAYTFVRAPSVFAALACITRGCIQTQGGRTVGVNVAMPQHWTQSMQKLWGKSSQRITEKEVNSRRNINKGVQEILRDAMEHTVKNKRPPDQAENDKIEMRFQQLVNVVAGQRTRRKVGREYTSIMVRPRRSSMNAISPHLDMNVSNPQGMSSRRTKARIRRERRKRTRKQRRERSQEVDNPPSAAVPPLRVTSTGEREQSIRARERQAGIVINNQKAMVEEIMTMLKQKSVMETKKEKERQMNNYLKGDYGAETAMELTKELIMLDKGLKEVASLRLIKTRVQRGLENLEGDPEYIGEENKSNLKAVMTDVGEIAENLLQVLGAIQGTLKRGWGTMNSSQGPSDEVWRKMARQVFQASITIDEGTLEDARSEAENDRKVAHDVLAWQHVDSNDRIPVDIRAEEEAERMAGSNHNPLNMEADEWIDKNASELITEGKKKMTTVLRMLGEKREAVERLKTQLEPADLQCSKLVETAKLAQNASVLSDDDSTLIQRQEASAARDEYDKANRDIARVEAEAKKHLEALKQALIDVNTLEAEFAVNALGAETTHVVPEDGYCYYHSKAKQLNAAGEDELQLVTGQEIIKQGAVQWRGEEDIYPLVMNFMFGEAWDANNEVNQAITDGVEANMREWKRQCYVAFNKLLQEDVDILKEVKRCANEAGTPLNVGYKSGKGLGDLVIDLSAVLFKEVVNVCMAPQRFDKHQDAMMPGIHDGYHNTRAHQLSNLSRGWNERPEMKSKDRAILLRLRQKVDWTSDHGSFTITVGSHLDLCGPMRVLSGVSRTKLNPQQCGAILWYGIQNVNFIAQDVNFFRPLASPMPQPRLQSLSQKNNDGVANVHLAMTSDSHSIEMSDTSLADLFGTGEKIRETDSAVVAGTELNSAADGADLEVGAVTEEGDGVQPSADEEASNREEDEDDEDEVDGGAGVEPGSDIKTYTAVESEPRLGNTGTDAAIEGLTGDNDTFRFQQVSPTSLASSHMEDNSMEHEELGQSIIVRTQEVKMPMEEDDEMKEVEELMKSLEEDENEVFIGTVTTKERQAALSAELANASMNPDAPICQGRESQSRK
jgi:hypothetical protein